MNTVSLDEYDPTPITHEWLVSLGFNLNHFGEYHLGKLRFVAFDYGDGDFRLGFDDSTEAKEFTTRGQVRTLARAFGETLREKES